MTENPAVNVYETESAVYFDGKPSKLILVPAVLKALVLVALAATTVFFLGWKGLLNPVSIVNEFQEKGLTADPVLVAMTVLLTLSSLWLVSLALYRWMSTRYRITDNRIEYERGIFSKTVYNVELWQVKDVFYRRTLLQFFFGLGMIEILATDSTMPKLEIGPIHHAKKIYDQLKKARQRAGRTAGSQAMGMSTS